MKWGLGISNLCESIEVVKVCRILLDAKWIDFRSLCNILSPRVLVKKLGAVEDYYCQYSLSGPIFEPYSPKTAM